MTRSNRQRSDSISAEINAHQTALVRIEPPEPLPAELMPLWHEIVEMRAVHEWSAIDLRLAVILVRTLSALETENCQMAAEKLLRRTRHGVSPNPRLEIVERLQKRVLTLQTRLLLSPRANGFRADRVAAQRKIERDARGGKDNRMADYLDAGGDPMIFLMAGNPFNVEGGMPYPDSPPDPMATPTRKRGNGKPR